MSVRPKNNMQLHVYLGGDSLLCCKNNTVLGKQADGSSSIGDRCCCIFDLIKSSFRAENCCS